MTYKPVHRDNELRDEVLADPEARAIYEATKLQIELALTLRNARKHKKMTQEDVAKLMHTHKPVVSRLESGNADVQHFPSLLTVVKFAAAVGYQLKLGLVPIKSKSTKSRPHPK
jgi:DNA-binding XRE family transcriptional regulator